MCRWGLNSPPQENQLGTVIYAIAVDTTAHHIENAWHGTDWHSIKGTTNVLEYLMGSTDIAPSEW